jgi:DNA recombination protein RmuC
MEWIGISFLSTALGWYLGRLLKAGVGLAEYHSLLQKEAACRQKIQELEIQLQDSKDKEETLQSKWLDLYTKLTTAQADNQSLSQQTQKQLLYFEELKKQTKLEFEHLAQEIFQIQTQSFHSQAEKNMNTLLSPFQEKLQLFEKKVQDTYITEAKERHSLKGEIQRLMGLNDQMSKDTQSLTQALRGDSKVQGDWGELVLERILESSGLTEGREYLKQKTFENDTQEKFKPDIIISLPQNKHLIIDAKVSLKAYDLYLQNAQAKNFMGNHIKSIERHIQQLSDKHYAHLKELNSPELVFLFIPIEPAYMLAMQADPDLCTKAWQKGIAIVSSTTLLSSLKTIASIWKLENQNKNALEIAQEAARLYDKFVGFVEDFEKLGKSIETSRSLYETATNKLQAGPGNVFRKIENLRVLGASPQKKIRADLLD